MRLAILLFCGAVAFGQSSAPPQPKTDPAAAAPDHSPREMAMLDVLSGTQGVDFRSFLQGVLENIKENWPKYIPESVRSKKGKLAIEFAVNRDGKVTGMKMTSITGDVVGLNMRPSSGDVSLDRAAWASITASNPFPALPSNFTGPSLTLRVRFYYNPDKNDFDNSGKKAETP